MDANAAPPPSLAANPPSLKQIEIVAGELAPVDCPERSNPPLKVGDNLPRQGEALFSIVRVEGAKVWLGPLKAGEHAVEVPCSADGATTVSLTIKLIEVKAEDLPPPKPPLPPERMAYPLWVWGAVLGLLLVFVMSMCFILWKRRRRLASTSSRRPAVPVRNPDEKFTHFLDSARKERWAERDEPDAVKRFYTEGYERLRDYLEFTLGFRAQEATTREFVGELKAALMRPNATPVEVGKAAPRRVAPGVAGQIESLMLQADQVRFAAERPPMELRQGFLKGLQQVRSAVGGDSP